VGRHGRRAALIAVITALTLALAAPLASAAPEIGDAGELPLTAAELGPQGPLTSIEGALTSTFDRDMYKICLTGRPFSASTVGLAGFDTQLFLLDTQGQGVYADDDFRFEDGSAVAQSELPAGDALTPTTPGVYYLAISAYNWDPQSPGGPIFGRGSGVVGPTRLGASLPISEWTAPVDQTAGGAYTIALTGTRSCVDTTPPMIELDVPDEGATYGQGDVVPATYACFDEADGSGIDACDGDVRPGQAIDTATPGAHSFTVTARDKAGNVASVSHRYTVLERTAPTIKLDVPDEGATYQRGEPVSAQYSCFDEDGGSGIAACDGDVHSGDPIDTSTLGEHTFAVTARDQAGNVTSVTHHYTVLDRSGPTIDLDVPGDGAEYARGSTVEAQYACFDEEGGSGIVACDGDVPSGTPIDTSRLGEHTFTVRTEDAAGNVTTATATYRVVEHFHYAFRGFLWPVRNRPRVNVVKAGSAVPVRFSLHGFKGLGVIAHGYPRSRQIPCHSNVEVDGGEQTHSLLHGGLRYNRGLDRYVYRWATDGTWAGTCRQFILKLDDGSYHRADFGFFRKAHRNSDDD
jgi:hypothetical protein